MREACKHQGWWLEPRLPVAAPAQLWVEDTTTNHLSARSPDMSVIHTAAPQERRGVLVLPKGRHSGPVSSYDQIRFKGKVLGRGWSEACEGLGSTCFCARRVKLKYPSSEGRAFPDADEARAKVLFEHWCKKDTSRGSTLCSPRPQVWLCHLLVART